jgi:acetyl-CoA carboxylase / biotin carboxylase 1
LSDTSELDAFVTLVLPLRTTVISYTKSHVGGVPGSERLLELFLFILREWIAIERWFYENRQYADAIDCLRRSYKGDLSAVLRICRAHEQLKVTSEIIIKIISTVADGTSVDVTNSTTALGKRVSMVTGAESLSQAMPAIAQIGAMGSHDSYADVALRARKLLMQESIPTLEHRRKRAVAAAKSIATFTEPSSLCRDAEAFLVDNMPISDVFFSVLSSMSETNDQLGLLELYARHLYRPYTIRKVERYANENLITFTFLNKPSESALSANATVTSMTDLGRITSANSLADASERSVNKERIPDSTLRTGVCALVRSLNDLENSNWIETSLKYFPHESGSSNISDIGPVNVLYLIFLEKIVGCEETLSDAMADKCQSLLLPYKAALLTAEVRRVSFVFQQDDAGDFEDCVPALFTYRHPEFKEDFLYRRIDPSHALHLDLNRVAFNFTIKALGSRHTTTCHVHLYEATPKASAMAKDTRANKLPRVFVRALSYVLDFSSSNIERILVDALNALDLCSLRAKSDNHLFLNLVGDSEKAVLDPVVVEQVIVSILKRHADRLYTLGIVEVEVRVVCRLSQDSFPIAIRLFASNPTGYVHVMNSYVEAVDESTQERIFKLIGGTKASLASTGDSSWDGLNVNTVYPLTRPFDTQRKTALKASDTLYCYDIPALFEAAVEQQWQRSSYKDGTEGSSRSAVRPLMVMYTTELVVQKKNGTIEDSWNMNDYLDGRLELVQLHRKAGANDVGMVAWLVTLKTVEYPNVRTQAYQCNGIICVLSIVFDLSS